MDPPQGNPTQALSASPKENPVQNLAPVISVDDQNPIYEEKGTGNRQGVANHDPSGFTTNYSMEAWTNGVFHGIDPPETDRERELERQIIEVAEAGQKLAESLEFQRKRMAEVKRRKAEEESARRKLEEQARAERGEKEERMRARVREVVHQNELIQQQIAAQVQETEALVNSYGVLGNPTANAPQPPIANSSRVDAPLDQFVAQELVQADVTSFLQPPTRKRPEREGEGENNEGHPPTNRCPLPNTQISRGVIA